MANESTSANQTPIERAPCRLICDAPGSGAWNMALDEVLLESALRDGVATLRFYRWSEPTVSLGYFQHLADREAHAPSRACPVVRRTTGGGAIIHDQELTYSLAIPADSPLAKRSTALYAVAHDSLIEALASWGIRSFKASGAGPEGCGAASAARDVAAEPFLCFERRACGDVIIDHCKVCGSAQRRSHGAILQHGSVLLGTSTAATELPGIRELADVNIHENELIAAWLPRFSKRLNFRATAADWTARELQSARALTTSRYGNPEWTGKK
jgi:lipoate-protein ligase A